MANYRYDYVNGILTAIPIDNNDVDLMKSHNKLIKIRVKLLDTNYVVQSDITGFAKDISYNIDSTSSVRRTCSMTVVVPQKSNLYSDFESVWINRMVELSIGVYYNNDYRWYMLGRMLMTDGNTTFTATSQEIKLSLVDLMSTLTESRGSQIGTGLTIGYGTNVKTLIQAYINAYGKFKNTSIVEFEDTIPYDLDIDKGCYPFELLQKILELFPYYEAYYNNMGTFVVNNIPTKVGDPIDVDHNMIDGLVLSENRSVKFSDIANTTEIWGRELDAQYTSTATTTDDYESGTGNRYTLTVPEYTTYVVNDSYAFTTPTANKAGQYMRINGLGTYQIYTQAGSGTYNLITANAMVSGKQYVVRYVDNGGGKFVLQGQSYIHAMAMTINTMPSATAINNYKTGHNCEDIVFDVLSNSPLTATVNSTTGAIENDIIQVMSGGDFESIYTTELAYERARYENYNACRLQDNVELEMVLVPWMDVNQKIEYTSPVTNQTQVLLVQSISYNISRWTMTVVGSKFYNVNPFA